MQDVAFIVFFQCPLCLTFAEKLRILRDHSSRVRDQHGLRGVNTRPDKVQAAILRVKLPYLDKWNAARQLHAKLYRESLHNS